MYIEIEQAFIYVIFLIFTIRFDYSNNNSNSEPTKTQYSSYDEDKSS